MNLQTRASKNFCWYQWGAERRVKLAQTRERGPPSPLAKILIYNLQLIFKFGAQISIKSTDKKCREVCILFRKFVLKTTLKHPPIHCPGIYYCKNTFQVCNVITAIIIMLRISDCIMHTVLYYIIICNVIQNCIMYPGWIKRCE